MPHLSRRLCLAALAVSWVAGAMSTAQAAEPTPWSDAAFAAAQADHPALRRAVPFGH